MGAHIDPLQKKRKKVKKKSLKTKLTKKVFLCDECGYSCNAMKTLMVHRAFKHGTFKENMDPSKTLQCDEKECRYTCSYQQHLKVHKTIVHEDNCVPLQCEQCSYQCRGDRERDMNIHMRAIHDDPKPFICTECERAFNKKSN